MVRWVVFAGTFRIFIIFLTHTWLFLSSSVDLPLTTCDASHCFLLTTSSVQLASSMKLIICPGCNRPFTHAGYSRHLSTTTRTRCRALYRNKIHTEAYGSPGHAFSGLDSGNPSDGNDTDGVVNPSAYFCHLLLHISLTYRYRWK